MLRNAFVFETRRPLGSAASLPVRLGVETFGTLSEARDNAVLVCHYLTGTSHVAGEGGWWADLVGPNAPVDTNRFFVVSMNSFSNVQANDSRFVTTGPDTLDDDGTALGDTFPAWTLADLFETQCELLHFLKLDRWHAVIGPSFGGMQALQWAARAPHLAPRIAAIACSPYAGVVIRGTFGPLLREVARLGDVREALRLVSLFGLGADGLHATFGVPDADFESYLSERAATASLPHLIDLVRAIETHDLREVAPLGVLAETWREAGTRLLTVNVRGDLFFPVDEARDFTRVTREANVRHEHVEIDSTLGHLACVAETHAFAPHLQTLLTS
ncbi:alpha/beta fold hydrolase [Deinococcus yavapaiensis]|uniref:Homoserine O-acetyltransferase n=1 Tax=Deinococcus yavapaiensis KR-236 TaxID=694435 RepID=A0A318SIL0_9DEIO|nr:alpha/beta fold hydrolase [Deinococcus yavapaiensis]PYE51803.1 homoserine O-acetyltransferase [Deinococcus yavapaiensis KR-236]